MKPYFLRKAYFLGSVQFSCSVVLWLCNPMACSTRGLPVHHQLLELAQTHVHRVSDAIQPSHLLPSPSPPVFNLSQHQVFSKESVLHIRWPKYWSFSFSISPSNDYSRLISFRIGWFGLLAVQGTLKNLLQHHSSKVSVLQSSAFFRVQLSHPYLTTGKTIALTRQTFVGKVMSLLFNMLSRLVLAQEKVSFSFRTAVTIHSDFGAQENKVCHCFCYFPIYLPWSDGTGYHDLSFLNVEFLASFFTLLSYFIKRLLSSPSHMS